MKAAPAINARAQRAEPKATQQTRKTAGIVVACNLKQSDTGTITGTLFCHTQTRIVSALVAFWTDSTC
jgi:hypothetical protein